MNKVYIPCGGGLGDLIMVYCSNPLDQSGQVKEGELPTSDAWASLWFRRLEDFKKKNPEVRVKVIMENHNPQSKELLKLHPCIDEIEQIPWQAPKSEDKNRWLKDYDSYKNIRLVYDYNDYQPCEAKIYMPKEEEDFVKDIDGRYIVIHPFARGTIREAILLEKYKEIINRLTEHGYKVIVVGGSYAVFAEGGHKVEEKFNYEREGLINLVNKVSVRVSVNLIFKANGFIGTHSCMILAAWAKRIKSICVVPDCDIVMGDKLQPYRRFWEGDDPTVWGLRQVFNKTIYVKNHQNVDIDEIVRWFIEQ